MKRLFALFWLTMAAPVFAHAGPHEAEGGPPGWTLDPTVTVPLLIAALLYAIGYVRLARRSGLGAGQLRRNAMLYASGLLVLALAVVSPLHEAGERSFTMHMIEHELIMLFAALLLVASRPLAVMLWAFPVPIRQSLVSLSRQSWFARSWRWLTDPVVATALQAIALWAWHAPPLFDRALGHEGWHVAQHLSFLVTALLFWWAMMHGRSGAAVSALCLFATSLIGGALGALMALSSSPWYAGYAALGMTPFGLTPTQDQQLAGLIMWIPGGLVHAVAAVLFLYAWLKKGETRDSVAAE